jgi:hypothetical protein
METLFFRVVTYLPKTNQIEVELSKFGTFSGDDYAKCAYDLDNLEMLNYQYYIKTLFDSLITHYYTNELFEIHNLSEYKNSNLNIEDELNKVIKVEYFPTTIESIPDSAVDYLTKIEL